MLLDIILAMPMISFLLVLIAGVLIGYALCSAMVADTTTKAPVAVSDSRLATMATLYGESRQEVERLRAERDAMSAESHQVRATIGKTEEHVRMTNRTIDKIREQREEVLLDLRQAQSERARVSNLLRDAEAEIAKLRGELRRVNDEQENVTAIHSAHESALQEISRLTASHNQVELAYSELRKAHALLHQELGHRQTVIAKLRHERDGAFSALAHQDSFVAATALPSGVEFSQCYDNISSQNVGKVA